ncbi:MAG TPA: uroporphyrinogen-III C-methyltransferase [Pyrinomonadaceae bacterium]
MGEGLRAILVVGHGSRRQEANDDVREVARKIAEQGGFELVEPAFLEIEQPDVAAGFKKLIERGACIVTVHPYFLSPGRHTRGDLPRQVGDVAAGFPGVRYEITEPLAAHPLVIEASIERIRETQMTSGLGARTFSPAGKYDEPWRARAGGDYRGYSTEGIVFLAGAGPGDPGLLTVRARDLLATCDVVVYDSLIDLEILRLTPPNVERIYAGKIGGGRSTSQGEINRLLIQRARAGKRVVRLKGGDPFLFGRGGEEAEALNEAGIGFEIVPGVSSALAVPAYAGIPLTHRGAASSVAIVSAAQARDGSVPLDQLKKVSTADTVVILMGVAHLHEITECLVECGRDLDTPVAVIRWGTYEAQQILVGTLSSIAHDVEAAGLRAPAVIVVGEVVRLRERLKWFEKSLFAQAAQVVAF